jgi:hypothetical protein
MKAVWNEIVEATGSRVLAALFIGSLTSILILFGLLYVLS